MTILTSQARDSLPQWQTEMLERTLEARRSMHMCSFFKNEQDQSSQAVPFVLSGLNTHQRCVYILDRSNRDDVMDSVARTKEIRDRIESGQLLFLTSQETYLKNGKFEQKRMLSLIANAHKEALADGYSGSVITGEMTWFNNSGTQPDNLLEYEARINDLYPGIEANLLCQYDESGLDPGLMMDVIRTHPKVILGGMLCSNPYYIPPEDYMSVRAGKVPWGVYERASGDILRRARLNLFRQEERAVLKKTGRKLQVLSDVALNDMESQLAVTQFYAELALDMCEEQKMREYITDLVRNCELMQKQLKFASQSQEVGEDDPEWQGLEAVVWSAAKSLGLERLKFNGSLAGWQLHADSMLETAFRGMLEFLGKGGEVRVSSKETEEGLVIELSSDRRGIPEDRKDGVFDRGYRDGERTWYELSLAKTVLEASGCSVRETGDQAKSVRFEILVPKARYGHPQ